MEKNEQPGIKTPVKKLSKQISQKYVQEIVEEAIKRAIKRLREKLNEKDILKIEKKLKSLSDEEKIKQFKKVIDKFGERIPGEGVNEELIEKISIEIEGKISSLLVSTAKMMLIAVIVMSTAAGMAYFILQPLPPEATIESITLNHAIEGDPILFIGSGAPDRSEDSITDYEWSLNNSILSGEDTFTTQDLPVGTHTIRFRVRDNHGKWSDHATSDIVVELNNSPILSVSPDPLSFKFGFETGESALQRFSVSNAGEGTLSWSVRADQPWITVRPASGVNSGTVTFNINTTGLKPSSYGGTIIVTSNGGTKTGTIDLNVIPPPLLSVFPLKFNFEEKRGDVTTGNPAPQTLVISNVGGGTLRWSVSDNQPWITLQPTGGINSGNVIVSVDTAGLKDGSYTGTITVSSNGGNMTSTINLDIVTIIG